MYDCAVEAIERGAAVSVGPEAFAPTRTAVPWDTRPALEATVFVVLTVGVAE